MFWKKFVKDYLVFGKKDRVGILFLCALGLIIYFLPRFFAEADDQVLLKERTALIKAIDTSTEERDGNPGGDAAIQAYQYEPTQTKSGSKAVLFRFDPNTLSFEGWQKLGLNERTSRTLINFRNKGGKFYKTEDLKKIWGMPEGFYESVKEYVVIAAIEDTHTRHDSERAGYAHAPKKIPDININEADTAAFIALPGIGPKLASRIITFRDKLGGFYAVDQIKETYGLPDSTFQKIRPYLQLNGAPKKLNVNTATKSELNAHPYIRWNLANAIVEYRNQHGSFKSLEELKNIAVMDEAVFGKVLPYLSL